MDRQTQTGNVPWGSWGGGNQCVAGHWPRQHALLHHLLQEDQLMANHRPTGQNWKIYQNWKYYGNTFTRTGRLRLRFFILLLDQQCWSVKFKTLDHQSRCSLNQIIFDVASENLSLEIWEKHKHRTTLARLWTNSANTSTVLLCHYRSTGMPNTPCQLAKCCTCSCLNAKEREPSAVSASRRKPFSHLFLSACRTIESLNFSQRKLSEQCASS